MGRGGVVARVAAGVVATLVAGMLAAAAPSSYADSQTAKDEAKDVLKVRTNGTVMRLRRNKTHDIVRSKATYAHSKLVLWIEVRNLASDDYIATWEVKTNNGHWVLHHDREQGPAYTSLFEYNGPEVLDCDGLRGDAVRRKDRVIVKVPRSCIDRPRWVKFGTSMGHQADPPFGAHILDDGRLTAGFYATHTKLGSRVRYN